MISSNPFWKRKCENLEKDRLTLVKFQFIQTQPIIDKTHLSTVLVLQGGNLSIVLVLQGGNLSKKWTIILLFFLIQKHVLLFETTPNSTTAPLLMLNH